MSHVVKMFLDAIAMLESFIKESDTSSEYRESLRLIDRAREVVQDEFELDISCQRKRRSPQERSLQKANWYQKKLRLAAQEQLLRVRGLKSQGILGHHVMVRVCLSNPFLNGRQLREWLSLDFDDGTQVISHTYVYRLRDAFVECLKNLCRKTLVDLVAVSPLKTPSVVVVHYHDEACMRFRSYDRVGVEHMGDAPNDKVFSRGRYSKVQNNAVFVKVVPAKQDVEWFTELQPLAAKDGATVATAIADVVRSVMLACSEAATLRKVHRIRLVHMLIGDGLNTNENVAKRIFYYFQTAGLVERVDYRLVVLKCSSHQSNLVVVVAIAGGKASNILDNCELCGTLSRVYKYLVPSYLEEFNHRLREIVLRRFVVCSDIGSPATMASQAQNAKLVALYGPLILPPELMMLLNRSVANMEHIGPADVDEQALRKKTFDVLQRLVILVEEKPVVTRFVCLLLVASLWCEWFCSGCRRSCLCWGS